MKNLIFFATLLIFISDHVFSAEAAKDDLPDPVLDLDGNEVKTGTSYYITSGIFPGGGVTIYPTANKTFTYAVAQLPLFGDGLPVTFANGGTDLGEVVRESTDIAIGFSPGMLFSPALWKVDDYDEAAKQYFVIAGDFDHGNQTSINIWFQIRKNRFYFCPKHKVCEFCAQICTDVGIYINDDGVRRFALDGFPSSFGFKKFQPCANSNGLEA